MSTTIQVSDVAKQRLDTLKERYQAATYDQVILRITAEQQLTPRAMFGSAKGIGSWKKEDRTRFKHEG